MGLLLGVYWTLLFIGTHLPPSRAWAGPNLGAGSDKWLHFGAFCGLSFLLAAYLNARHWSLRATALAVLAVGPVYGIIDEALQLLVGRHADVWDLAADVAGIGVGFLFARLVLPWSRERPQPFHVEV